MDELQYKTVEPERIKMGVVVGLSKELLGVQVDFREELLTNQICMYAHGYLWGRNDELIELKYPLDWWQAFKERWFPKSLLNRHPVVYRTHRIDVREIYPDYRPAISDQTYRLKLAKYNGTQSALVH